MERGKSGGRGGKKKVDGSKGEGKKVKMWDRKKKHELGFFSTVFNSWIHFPHC